MNKLMFFFTLLLSICTQHPFAQKVPSSSHKPRQEAHTDSLIIAQYRQIEPYFQEAYAQFSTIPKGILEAVAFTYTRFTHRKPDILELENSAIPATYGVMGLTLDGKGVFRNNLRYIAELSGISMDKIIGEPRENIRAYAAAYAALQKQFQVFSPQIANHFPILNALSELPLGEDSVLNFARQSNLYSICQFLDNPLFRSKMSITMVRPDYQRCFGKLLPLLQAGIITLSLPSSKAGTTDFSEALWNPAGSCNYSVGRNNHTISAIALHYTQGTYAGSIAWFRNCTYNGVGAQASAHYLIRSYDGQITQMVREADKAWHVGNCNSYTIGIEHEAYSDIASFFTDTMYQTSANLTRNICQRNNISPLRMFYRDTLDDGTVLNHGLHNLGGETSCIKIKGHQHFPNQTHTDPGHFWDWNYYYKLVNNTTPVSEYRNLTGTLTDSGGDEGNYANDERTLQLIHIEGADSITLSFDEFELESNYDFMWIYDGNSVFAPLIGRWNTTSPGSICSTGDALLVEFRSDCATTKAGWLAHWTAHRRENDQIPETRIRVCSTLPAPNPEQKYTWITQNTPVSFIDTDDGDINYRFYQIIGNDGTHWTANVQSGFAYDNFDDFNQTLWSVQNGNWEIQNGKLQQTLPTNASIFMSINISTDRACLYDFTLTIPQMSGVESWAGIELINQNIRNRKYSYKIVVSPTESQLKILKIQNNLESIVYTLNNLSTHFNEAYHYRIIYDKASEKIIIFRNGTYLGQYQGENTFLVGNGKGIAFCCYGGANYDDLRVYISRNDNINMRVNGNEDCEACYQATNGIAQCKITSVVVDDQWQFSNLAERPLLIDYTPPTPPRYMADGGNHDVDFLETYYLIANWGIATDPHSNILEYEYGVAPAPDTNLIHWLGRTTNKNFDLEQHRPLRGVNYIAVRAYNRAGLCSEIKFTDGCYYLRPGEPFVIDITTLPRTIGKNVGEKQSCLPQTHTSTATISLFPNPAKTTLHIGNCPDFSRIRIFNSLGQVLMQHSYTATEQDITIDISSLPAGIYFLQLIEKNGAISQEKFIKK